MARRRSKLPRTLLLFGAAAAIAWAGWRFGPQWLGRGNAPHASTEACRLAPAPRLAERIGRVAVEAQRQPAVAGVPAASACAWIFFGGRVLGRVYTPGSLAAGGVDLAPGAYFGSIATGLEYEFKAAPQPVAGLGDEALAAGFGTGTADRPQVVLRLGDRVLTLEFEGLEREAAVAFARELAGGL